MVGIGALLNQVCSSHTAQLLRELCTRDFTQLCSKMNVDSFYNIMIKTITVYCLVIKMLYTGVVIYCNSYPCQLYFVRLKHTTPFIDLYNFFSIVLTLHNLVFFISDISCTKRFANPYIIVYKAYFHFFYCAMVMKILSFDLTIMTMMQ